jgi:hypothetical protein
MRIRLPATRTGRAFQIAAIASALAVGALQMYHVRGGMFTDYGADAFGTAWVYATIRLGGTIIQRGRPATAARSAWIVFLLCVGWELGQKMHLVPGYYDPYDIVTYAAALVTCWAIDRLAPFVRADLVT